MLASVNLFKQVFTSSLADISQSEFERKSERVFYNIKTISVICDIKHVNSNCWLH